VLGREPTAGAVVRGARREHGPFGTALTCTLCCALRWWEPPPGANGLPVVAHRHAERPREDARSALRGRSTGMPTDPS